MFDNIEDVACNMSYFLVVWFAFILFFGSKSIRFSSLILTVYWLLYVILYQLKLFDPLPYLDITRILNRIDGSIGLMLTMFLWVDKNASKHALLLAFAVLCHTMLLYDLTKDSNWFSLFFYNWYDELIILVCLLQITVSYNGFNRARIDAPRKLQGSIFGVYLHYRYYRESIFKT